MKAYVNSVKGFMVVTPDVKTPDKSYPEVTLEAAEGLGVFLFVEHPADLSLDGDQPMLLKNPRFDGFGDYMGADCTYHLYPPTLSYREEMSFFRSGGSLIFKKVNCPPKPPLTLRDFLVQGLIKQTDTAAKTGIPSPDALTDDQAHFYVNTFLCHLIEEAVEARMLVPRRHWKKVEPSYLESAESQRDFCYELCDILLFLRATIVYSKIPIDTVLKHFEDKIAYNEVRKDHKG